MPSSPPRLASRFPAIVFDLDGTLIDSAPDIHLALNRTLAEAGRGEVTLESVKLMIGDGARLLVARGFAATGPALDDGAVEEEYRRFLERYEGPDSVVLTRPYPGVVETLEQLIAAGHCLGLCTNKPHGPTLDVLERLSLARYFAAVMTPEQVSAHKPDPAHLRAVLEALGVAAEEAVMVGDNANDVAVARAAAVPVVAVTYGYPRMAPEALGADLLIDRMAELPEALGRLG
jgi:phosphoglycolate phosphatase